MKIYNSYTNQLEVFEPITKGKVNMYVCGPTVYGYIHIGNTRPVIVFDMVRRYFQYSGYEVKYASNFTDVDDKIINQAKIEKMTELELSSKYIEAFLRDASDLGCLPWDENPKVTDYMDRIIDFIGSLIESNHAYESYGDVFFRVHSVPGYGSLSGQNIDDLDAGSRIQVNTKKENPMDFTLWKATEDGINWDSPWSKGRPGWHTECVAMVNDLFGDKIDIHGGGSGLKFPHHENEVAQSVAKNNSKLANYWMHNGLLFLNDSKMSKSIGNTIYVSDLLKEIPYQAFKLMMLSTHYRQPINYNDEIKQNSLNEWTKLDRVYKQIFRKLDLNKKFNRHIVISKYSDLLSEFTAQMDEDFNTPNAIAVLQKVMKLINQELRTKEANFDSLNELYKILQDILFVLGLDGQEMIPMSDIQRELYLEWEQARKNKDFEKADNLRNRLIKEGVLD